MTISGLYYAWYLNDGYKCLLSFARDYGLTFNDAYQIVITHGQGPREFK